MPIVTIDIWQGRDKATRGKLIKEVSKTVAGCLGCDIKHVQVILNEVPKENWGVGGTQACELKLG